MRPDRYYPRPDVGVYQPSPSLPVGRGWCEVIVKHPDRSVRRCYTFARFDREGHRVCGLHTEDRCARPDFGSQGGDR